MGVARRRWSPPLFGSFKGWTKDYLGRDILAGLTLAAITVPEQMATAKLGGFEPQIGFYAFIGATVGLVLAQSQTSWVKVGGLSCTMSPTIGLLVVEEQTVNCQFTPHGRYPSEHYTGTIGTVGIAVGVVGGGMLAWAVYMPTQGRHKVRSPAPTAEPAAILI
jgi:MFS superfamily sulfate permease-like transporter